MNQQKIQNLINEQNDAIKVYRFSIDRYNKLSEINVNSEESFIALKRTKDLGKEIRKRQKMIESML